MELSTKETQPAEPVAEPKAGSPVETQAPVTVDVNSLMPQTGIDYVAAMHQIFQTGMKIIDQILDGCTEVLKLLPEQDRNNALMVANFTKQFMVGAETLTRAIWQTPQFRDGANAGMSYLVNQQEYQTRMRSMETFNRWANECAIPQFTGEIMPKYPTVQDAIRNGLVDVGQRAREWIRGNVPGLSSGDIDRLAIEFGKVFQQKVIPQIEQHWMIQLLSQKKVEHPRPLEIDGGQAIRDIKGLTPRLGK